MSEKHKCTCFYCRKEFEYGSSKYRDIDCPHCGVMNSVYDPAEYSDEIKTEEGEEDMSLDYSQEKYQSKYVYLPKVGESAEFDIVEIYEVKSDNARINFNDNVAVMQNGEPVFDDDGEQVFKKKDLGYHIEAKLADGKLLSVNSLAAFHQVFKKNEIQDGAKIKVDHPEKGKWKVEIL